MTISDISLKIIPILKKHDVSKAALFGSVARGEATQKSDVDILVEFSKRKSLFDLSLIQYTLEDILNKKVDLVTYDSIDPLIRDYIMSDEKIIYEENSPILS